MLHVQANVPAALAGQSGLLLLLGDAEVTNNVSPADAFVPASPVVAVTTSASTVLRLAPGASGAAAATVPAGTALQADAQSPGGIWVRVMYNNAIAWVSAADLEAFDATALPTYTADSLTPFQSFDFRTGFDNFGCTAAPPSLIIVQSPVNTPIDLVANGVDITVDGVVFLRLLPGNFMQLLTSAGETTVYPDENTRVVVPAGISLDIPLGAVGTWENWTVQYQEVWDQYGSLTYIPGPVLITVIVIPDIITPSVIVPGGVIIVETPTGTYVVRPPSKYTFPIIELVTGEFGDPLPRSAWEAINIGCAVCTPELVIYHSDSDGDWDLYRLQADGLNTPANNLSAGPNSADVQPTYSADGMYFAYASNRDLLGRWEIYVGRTDGSSQARLTYNSGTDVNPVWGPANLLAFESNRDGDWNLYMADVSGDGIPVQLTDDPANDINAFWFPDGGCGQPEGGRLVFQSDRDGDWEIFELDVITGDLTQLTDNDVEDVQPVLTPDGSTLGFLRENEFGVYDLWVMDLATMQERRLTDLGVDIEGHIFSPDGAIMAFASNADGDFDIFAVDVTTALLKAVTQNDAEDRSPSFRCDNTVVIYHSDIAVTDTNPGQRELYEVNPWPLDQPAGFPARLTQDVNANDVHPLADPNEERNSLEGRAPEHP